MFYGLFIAVSYLMTFNICYALCSRGI